MSVNGCETIHEYRENHVASGEVSLDVNPDLHFRLLWIPPAQSFGGADGEIIFYGPAGQELLKLPNRQTLAAGVEGGSYMLINTPALAIYPRTFQYLDGSSITLYATTLHMGCARIKNTGANLNPWFLACLSSNTRQW